MALRLWPFEPSGPIRETLEFRTDIQRTYTTETRHSIRRIPRQTIGLSHEPGAETFSAMKATLRAGLDDGDTWLCPLWFAAQRIEGVLSGATTLDVGPWVDCYGERLLILPDTVLTIASKVGTVVTLTAPLVDAIAAGTVVPLIEGFIAAGPEVTRTGPRSQTVGVAFTTDRPSLTPVNPYPDLAGRGLVVDRRCLPVSLQSSISRAADFVGSETGTLDRAWSRATSEHYQGLLVRGANPADTQASRAWLGYLMGRRRAFWAPEWNGDIVPVASLGASSITAKRLGDRFGLAGRRVLIRKKDGSEAVRTITTITEGANWTVNLDASIGFSATPAEIDLITVVSLFRGDADTFDLTHFTGGQMEVVLPMAEVTE